MPHCTSLLSKVAVVIRNHQNPEENRIKSNNWVIQKMSDSPYKVIYRTVVFFFLRLSSNQSVWPQNMSVMLKYCTERKKGIQCFNHLTYERKIIWIPIDTNAETQSKSILKIIICAEHYFCWNLWLKKTKHR